MKYLIYLISLLFVLAFAGCDKAKEAPADVKTEAVEEAVEEVAEEAEEAVKEVTE